MTVCVSHHLNPRTHQPCTCPEPDTAQAHLMAQALQRIAERKTTA